MPSSFKKRGDSTTKKRVSIQLDFDEIPDYSDEEELLPPRIELVSRGKASEKYQAPEKRQPAENEIGKSPLLIVSPARSPHLSPEPSMRRGSSLLSLSENGVLLPANPLKLEKHGSVSMMMLRRQNSNLADETASPIISRQNSAAKLDSQNAFLRSSSGTSLEAHSPPPLPPEKCDDSNLVSSIIKLEPLDNENKKKKSMRASARAVMFAAALFSAQPSPHMISKLRDLESRAGDTPPPPGEHLTGILAALVRPRPDSKDTLTEHRAREICLKVGNEFLRKYKTWGDAFAALDDEKSGRILTQDLYGKLKSFHLGITDAELKMLISAIDEDHNGDIDFAEFKLLAIEGGDDVGILEKELASAALAPVTRRKSNKNIETMISRLRLMMFKKYRDLVVAFEDFDKNRDGSVSVAELQWGFRINLGIHLTEHQLLAFIDLVAVEPVLSLQQFCVLFADNIKRPTEDVLWLRASVKAAIRNKFPSVTDAFEYFDSDKRGVISGENFMSAVKTLVPASADSQCLMLARICGLGSGGGTGIEFDSFIKVFVNKHTAADLSIPQQMSALPKNRSSIFPIPGAGALSMVSRRKKLPSLQTPAQPITVKQIGTALFDFLQKSFGSCDVGIFFEKAAKSSLDRATFLKVLRQIKFAIGEPHALTLFMEIDSSNDGIVDRIEFENFYKSVRFSEHENWVPTALLTEISNKLRAKFLTLQAAFHDFDKNGDGRISGEELQEGLGKVGIILSEEKLVQVLLGGEYLDETIDLDFVAFIKALSPTNCKKMLLKLRASSPDLRRPYHKIF